MAATHIGTIGLFGRNDMSDGRELCMATCDLAADGSGEWKVMEDWFSLEYTNPAVEARKCEMYVRFQRQVLVLKPRPGTGRRLVEVESLEEPWVAPLGVDDGALARHFFATLVTHRGAVFLVVGLERASMGASVPVEVMLQCDVGVRVWRLVRERNVWEPVARLGPAVAQRLTSVVERVLDDDLRLVEASGVREFLCCHVRLRTMKFMVGVNLDTGGWELIHREPSLLCTELEREDFVSTSYRAAKMVELRPDLFL